MTETRERTIARRLRRLVAASTATAMVGLLLLVPGVAGAQEATEEPVGDPGEGLGGYTSEGQGAPLSVLLFEPVTPVPVDPGQPHLRADHAYVLTNLATGPAGRALASTVWPGPLVGDGFNLITGQGDYPLKTDLTSPGQETEQRKEAPGGAGMYSFAQGSEVRAKAQAGESPAGEQVAFGNLDGESYGRLEAGRAITTTTAVAQDVVLAGGVVTIDSVETVVTTASDGTTAETAGHTTVSGLTIAGNGYVVDEDGLRPAGGDPAAGAPPVPGSEELAENLGITVRLLGHEEVLAGARASRAAGGLEVRIDLGILRSQVDTGPVEDVVDQVPAVPDPGVVPPEVTDELPFDPFGDPYLTLLPAFLLSPEVVYVLGNASSETVATEPLSFDFPAPLPPPPPPAPPAPAPSATSSPTASTTTTTRTPTTTTTTRTPVRSSGGSAPVTTSTAPVTTTTVEQPAVAQPQVQPVAQPAPLGIVTTEGVPALLAIAGLLGAIAGGWGLRALGAAALGTAGLCDLGSPTDLPTITKEA